MGEPMVELDRRSAILLGAALMVPAVVRPRSALAARYAPDSDREVVSGIGPTQEESQMADHGAGPRATANPEIDITDLFAFPSPERPGHLVIIMDVCPFKQIEASRLLFSDAIDYRIRIRPARIGATGPGAAVM